MALGKIPGLRADRAGIALAGAAMILGCRSLSFAAAVKAVDFATIALLLGMMIVVAFLRRAGFFEVLANWALERLHRPAALLAVTMLLSGGLSALLVNDVVCLALTPLVLHLAREKSLDPKPFLIGLAIASNVGSTATLTGNPQNMIIGGLSQISYLRFAVKLAPIAMLGLVVAYLITAIVYRIPLGLVGGEGRIAPAKHASPAEGTAKTSAPPLTKLRRRLLVKSVLVTCGAIGLFAGGAPMEVVALGAAAILLLDRVEPKKIYRQIDWGLLVMFAGLFVVVEAFQAHVLAPCGIEHWQALLDHPVGLLSLVSAGLSNLVSNVPAVLLFESVIPAMSNGVRETAWLALAMSSTLAGNLTVLGSVANLIVVESARAEGVSISLMDYCRAGIPVTIATLAIGMGWLTWAHY